MCIIVFFFQAEDGIRDLVRSRGLVDVYKRQDMKSVNMYDFACEVLKYKNFENVTENIVEVGIRSCLLYTSDAADERSSVDLGGRRIIKKKT